MKTEEQYCYSLSLSSLVAHLDLADATDVTATYVLHLHVTAAARLDVLHPVHEAPLVRLAHEVLHLLPLVLQEPLQLLPGHRHHQLAPTHSHGLPLLPSK